MVGNKNIGYLKNKIDMETTEIFQKGQQLPKEWFSGNAFLTPLVAKDKNNRANASKFY